MNIKDLLDFGLLVAKNGRLGFPPEEDNFLFHSFTQMEYEFFKRAKRYTDNLKAHVKAGGEIHIIKPIEKTNEFMVVDVETACRDKSSICQIGIAVFRNGEIIDKWESLINPQCRFDSQNTVIHGIREKDVANAPKINEVADFLSQKYFKKYPAYSYGSFDRIAFDEALPQILNIQWIDITYIVRRTWHQFSRKGYNLAQISRFLGIENTHHHNALSDAIVAGQILCRALSESDTSLKDWDIKIKERLPSPPGEPLSQEPNQEGRFFGKSIVFTGMLSMPRSHLESIAMDEGFRIKSSVSKKVDFLVNGVQVAASVQNGESTKFRKAQELKNQGHHIRIISEQDFHELISGVE